MHTTVLVVLVALFVVCIASEDVRVDVVLNEPAASESSSSDSSGYGVFSTANIIGMFMAIIALIAIIIIFIAASHFGRKEIEKEEQMVVKRQKEEEEKYERARVFELTRIGV
jgi:uncharacterized membrane protein